MDGLAALIDRHAPGFSDKAKQEIAKNVLANGTNVWHEIAAYSLFETKCFCALCDDKGMKLVHARRAKYQGREA